MLLHVAKFRHNCPRVKGKCNKCNEFGTQIFRQASEVQTSVKDPEGPQSQDVIIQRAPKRTTDHASKCNLVTNGHRHAKQRPAAWTSPTKCPESRKCYRILATQKEQRSASRIVPKDLESFRLSLRINSDLYGLI